MNLYTCCKNEPIKYRDPMGYAPKPAAPSGSIFPTPVNPLPSSPGNPGFTILPPSPQPSPSPSPSIPLVPSPSPTPTPMFPPSSSPTPSPSSPSSPFVSLPQNPGASEKSGPTPNYPFSPGKRTDDFSAKFEMIPKHFASLGSKAGDGISNDGGSDGRQSGLENGLGNSYDDIYFDSSILNPCKMPGDERFDTNNPIVAEALRNLTANWDAIVKLERDLGIDLTRLKNEIHELANLVRMIGDEIKVKPNNSAEEAMFERLNATEKVIFASNPLYGAYVGAAAETADQFYNYGDGTIYNARRHAYWNALSVLLTGSSDYVKFFTNAHEYGNRGNFNNNKNSYGVSSFDHTLMDLHNNYVGRLIGKDLLDMWWVPSEVKPVTAKETIDKLTTKELKVLT